MPHPLACAGRHGARGWGLRRLTTTPVYPWESGMQGPRGHMRGTRGQLQRAREAASELIKNVSKQGVAFTAGKSWGQRSSCVPTMHSRRVGEEGGLGSRTTDEVCRSTRSMRRIKDKPSPTHYQTAADELSLLLRCCECWSGV